MVFIFGNFIKFNYCDSKFKEEDLDYFKKAYLNEPLSDSLRITASIENTNVKSDEQKPDESRNDDEQPSENALESQKKENQIHLDIKFNGPQSQISSIPANITQPNQNGFLNVTTRIHQSSSLSPASITPAGLTPSPTATINLNWPIVQNKIDDLNE